MRLDLGGENPRLQPRTYWFHREFKRFTSNLPRKSWNLTGRGSASTLGSLHIRFSISSPTHLLWIRSFPRIVYIRKVVDSAASQFPVARICYQHMGFSEKKGRYSSEETRHSLPETYLYPWTEGCPTTLRLYHPLKIPLEISHFTWGELGQIKAK